MKKKTSKKTNHDFYIVRSWYEWEDYEDYSSTTYNYKQKRSRTWKILVFCKKCGEVRLLSIKDE